MKGSALFFKGLTKPVILVLGHIISQSIPNPQVYTHSTTRITTKDEIFLKTIFREALKTYSFDQTTEVNSPNFLNTKC